jgi:hypothetical protein
LLCVAVENHTLRINGLVLIWKTEQLSGTR